MSAQPIRNILVTGAAGFIGRRLLGVLCTKGYRATALIRAGENTVPGVGYIRGDPATPGNWQDKVMNQDAVVTLTWSSQPFS
jgi:nucleoside-diphosphate-sugar epimerase